MQNIEFQIIVKKGNNRGAGFISIPKEMRNNFKIDSQIKSVINHNTNIYAKMTSSWD